LLLPTLAGAGLYGTLYFRTEDKTARYRIATTSSAFLLWFGSAAIASVTPLHTWSYWPPMARLVGLVATLLIIAAYKPPRWLQAKYDIRPVESPPDRRAEAMRVRLTPVLGPAA
jgi:hypothetical protein